MTHDLKDSRPPERRRVNVTEDWEISFWTKQLGCTEAELKAAVLKVGTDARDVQRQLAKRYSVPSPLRCLRNG
jgi:hypothetical protein